MLDGGARLWVKRDDLTGSALSGNKVRKLEFLLADAEAQGADTLITCGGLQSNHCRATALVGAQLGLHVHLLLRGREPESSEGNYLLDQLAGASISCYGPKQYFGELDALFEQWQAHYASEGGKALAIPTGGSDGIGVWGYIAACEELLQDFTGADIGEAHLVCASGSGGTQAGLTAGAELTGLPATVWAVNVCDDEQYFLDKVAADAADWRRRYPGVPAVEVQPGVIDGYVGQGYGIADQSVFNLIGELAALEGLVLDPVYTGKTMAGMIDLVRKGYFDKDEKVLFVHTGGSPALYVYREEILG